MITLTPNSVPLDISHVLEVLALVSDPQGCKARLTELTELLDRANFGIEQANSLHADATQRMTIYQASAENLAKDKAAFEALTSEVDARQSATDAALTARKAVSDAARASWMESMSQREKDVSRREQDVTAREAAVVATSEQVEAMQADLQTKLAKLREAMGEKP